MMKQLFTALFAVTLIFAFSTVTFAQDKDAAKAKSEMKMQMKKEQMKKDQMMKEHGMAGLYSLKCDPTCGFRVVSKDKAEIVAMTKEHMKKHHPDMTMTDAQIEEMIKPAGEMMKGDMMRKKVEKEGMKKPDGI